MNVNISTVFVLLIAYQLKHFLADYPLQNFDFMKGKFKQGWDFVGPLAAHCCIHAVGTGLIATFYVIANGKLGWTWRVIGLAAFDFCVHFLMDRCKASPTWMGRWKALSAAEFMAIVKRAVRDRRAENEMGRKEYWALYDQRRQDRIALRHNTIFWNCLGIDQLVHHLTHYAIILALVLA